MERNGFPSQGSKVWVDCSVDLVVDLSIVLRSIRIGKEGGRSFGEVAGLVLMVGMFSLVI